MARIEIDPNYSAPTFSRATAGADIFKKEDVQGLAAAFSTHVHDNIGKGLPVVFTAPVDLPNWFRTTGHPTAFPTTGVGMELYYEPSAPGTAYVNVVNRADGSYRDLMLLAKSFDFTIGGVASAMQIANNRTVTVTQALTVVGAATMSSTLAVGGTSALSGTVTLGASAHIHPAAGGRIEWPAACWIQDYTPGYVQISALHVVNNLEVAGSNATFSGDVVGIRFFPGLDGTRNIRGSGTGIIYEAGSAGGHAFQNTGGGAAPLACGPVTSTGGGTSSFGGALSASQVTVPNSLYANGCVINNGTNNAGVYLYVNGPAGGTSGWNIIPSSINFKSNLRSLDEALGLVKDDTLHGVYYTVSPENLEPFNAYGFLAEPWFAKAPETVNLDEAGQPQGMDYTQVVPIVFEALKEYIAATDARLAVLEAA